MFFDFFTKFFVGILDFQDYWNSHFEFTLSAFGSTNKQYTRQHTQQIYNVNMDLFKHAFLLSPCCPVSLREDYSCQVEFWHVNLLIITVSGKEGLNTQLNIMLEMVKYDLDVPLYAWVETPTDCCACCLWLMCVACTTRTLARAHTCLITYKQAHYKWQHVFEGADEQFQKQFYRERDRKLERCEYVHNMCPFRVNIVAKCQKFNNLFSF